MAQRPHIWIQRSDYHRLAGLAEPPDASPLAEELARAIVCHARDLPSAVVRMGDRVVFRRDLDAAPEWGELVYPDRADGVGRISVTSALGAAMIGLRAGAHMTYRDDQGQRRRLVIVRVVTA